MFKFIRTCQECGHEQESKDPATYKGKSESWRDVKCRKCGSASLNYGRNVAYCSANNRRAPIDNCPCETCVAVVRQQQEDEQEFSDGPPKQASRRR